MVRKFYKNDEGVSAVIGVILIVAITVILAALIAAYVFNIGGNVEKSKTVAVDVKRTTCYGRYFRRDNERNRYRIVEEWRHR